MVGKVNGYIVKIIPVHIDDHFYNEMSKGQVKNAGYEIFPYRKWVKIIE